MQVSLVMFKVDGSRWDFAVNKPRIVIGRTGHCDLRIPLSSVSRQHCEVRIDGDQVKLRDLGSSNGTHHNHIRVQEATLKPGDEILVGPVVFTVVIDGEPEVVEPRRTMIGSPPKKSPPAAADETQQQQHPQPLEVNSIEDFPTLVEAETHSPTVNFDDEDDDALASLQALAAASESDDSSELPLLIDEDEETPPAQQKP